MAEQLWTDDEPQWVEFGWVEGFHETIVDQWVECGWFNVGWVEGDSVCLMPVPDDEPQMGIGWDTRPHQLRRDDERVITAVLKCFLQIQQNNYLQVKNSVVN